MIVLKYLLDAIKVLIKLLIYKIKNIYKPIRIKFTEQKSRKAIIMGNGPSLNNDLPEILNYPKNDCDFYSVNFFANTETFYQIKPNYYFLADKLFWSNNLNDDFNSLVNSTFDTLSKVDWKISILCPESGFNFIKSKLSSNCNFSFIRIPDRPINLFSEKIHLKLLEKRFFSIPNVNSVITIIWFSIISKYDSIILYGVDFSAFKSLHVDQETNEVFVPTEHFYKNSLAEKNSAKKYLSQKNKTMSQRLYQVFKSFHVLETLFKLSRVLNVEVLNLSSFSYIDSFPREK